MGGSTRTFLGLVIGLLLAGLSANTVLATHISHDAYADAVQSSSGTGVNNPNAALGPPDGTSAGTLGVQRQLTLDMGAGEEGTGTLRVYFGAVLLRSQMTVDFLDEGLNVIKSVNSQAGASSEAHTQDFAFGYAEEGGEVYRYVRFTNLADAGNSIDAIQALSFIGSSATVDTDGDCVPDRDEQHGSTDPAVDDNDCDSPPPPPGPTCTQDGWACGDWSACSVDGNQTRACSMIFNCPGVSTPSPATSRSCTPPVPPPAPATCDRDVWTCGEWSQCSVDGRESRACVMTVDCPTAATPSPATGRACTPAPAPAPAPSPAPAPAPAPGGGTTIPGATGADTTAPVITNVTADALNATTELIRWLTDEPANGQVEYGVEGGTSTQLSPLEATLGGSHAITLSDLQPGTAYTFRVYSRDAAGNLAISPEHRFVTPQGLVITLPSGWFAGWTACHWGNLILLLLLIASVIGNVVQAQRARKEVEVVEKEPAPSKRRRE